MAAMLDVKNINVYVTLIGANGAGKTTTLQTVSGLLHSRTGSIEFLGQPIQSVPAAKLVGRGLAQVPEGRRVFQHMTVEENLEMGGFTQPNSTIAPNLERVYEQFPRLKERRRQVAGTLSGGEQQMLAMGRALMSNPKLLMPSACTRRAPPSCWWSRTPRWPSAWPTGATCWRPGASPSPARVRNCWPTRPSKRHTWADKSCRSIIGRPGALLPASRRFHAP